MTFLGKFFLQLSSGDYNSHSSHDDYADGISRFNQGLIE
jgi:hypothetical protein